MDATRVAAAMELYVDVYRYVEHIILATALR